MQTTSMIEKQMPDVIRGSVESRFKRWIGLMLISPWLIGLLLFSLIPILASFVLSFTDFHLLTPEQVQFIGIENYVGVVKDKEAWRVLWLTIRLALIVIPLQTLASIFIAALLSSQRLWKRDFLRTLFFLPSIIPAFSAALMWRGYVNPDTGWLNRLILGPIGLSALDQFFLGGVSQPLFILSSLWTIGPGILIMMGAMQGIPNEVYEAAIMDGANRLTRFFRITIPMITPAIFFSLVLNITAVFGGAMLLDHGDSFRAEYSSYDGYVRSIIFDIYHLGYAASLAWVFFVIVMILVLILFRTSKNWVYFPDQDK
ncbi:MAG: sugar ABC transporter permease [Anaerolineales bacterium]